MIDSIWLSFGVYGVVAYQLSYMKLNPQYWQYWVFFQANLALQPFIRSIRPSTGVKSPDHLSPLSPILSNSSTLSLCLGINVNSVPQHHCMLVWCRFFMQWKRILPRILLSVFVSFCDKAEQSSFLVWCQTVDFSKASKFFSTKELK